MDRHALHAGGEPPELLHRGRTRGGCPSGRGGPHRGARWLVGEAEGHPAAHEEEPDAEHPKPGAPEPAGPGSAAALVAQEGGHRASRGIRAHGRSSPQRVGAHGPCASYDLRLAPWPTGAGGGQALADTTIPEVRAGGKGGVDGRAGAESIPVEG
jgi:hypothetical protein